MDLGLTSAERVARARAELRIGAPVAMVAADGAGCVFVAAEALTAGRLDALRALGPLDLAISVKRAETIRARAYDGDIARIALGDAFDLRRIAAAVDPALALTEPYAGPFPTRREGAASAHRLAIRLCKQARLLPAAVAAPVEDATALARAHALTLVSEADVASSAEIAGTLEAVASAPVPLTTAPDARVLVFRPEDGAEEHYAVEIGQPSRAKPVLTRLHSACFTGDLVGSLKCDCGPQLRAALAQIGAEGSGVLLYLNQEGRGIGLANKLRAYALQAEGFDTVEANHRLGFEDDERNFLIGSAILRRMGFNAVRLMTNNPGKLAAMESAGLSVAGRVPLIVGRTEQNAAYLAVKAAKSGHLF